MDHQEMNTMNQLHCIEPRQCLHGLLNKLFSLLFVILVCGTKAFAADPGQVVKVDAQSITVHWQTPEAYIPGRSDLDSSQKHGIAVGGYGGSSRQFTFKLTPQTTYWQGGTQVTITSIHKGATVKVTATHEVASRVDIL
jgi:hypothetical protein